MSRSIDELSVLVAEMPGIGPRQARRVVQFLLRADSGYKEKLTRGIKEINTHVSQCLHCFRYDETSAEKLCLICANSERDTSLLMVVEKDVDIESIETAGIYKGLYFVLGGLMPLARQRKNKVAPRTDSLFARIGKEEDLKEIIIAFATTPEGDFTASELSKKLQEEFLNTKISMLGRGLSLGAEIEYADQETLRNAFAGRN